MVELLLRKNADVNIKSELGFTPLHLACELGKKHMIQLLLHNKADPNIQNNEGQTPFHLAFYKKQYVVSLLQTHISKNINLIDSRGLSYFHILCTTHSHTAIVALLQSGAATVDMCVVDDKGAFSGYSALHFAVEFNRENIVELLLQHNANVNYCPSFRKITPLHLACMHRDVKYHELPDPEELKNDQYQIKNTDWTLSQRSQINIIKLLLDHKCNVNARDQLEKSALMYACEIHNVQMKCLYAISSRKKIYKIAIEQLWLIQKEIIDILILNNADIHIHTLARESILHLIIKSDHASLELCTFFIEKGLEVHSLDDTGSSLLHHAVNMADEFKVKFLLDHNLDVNIKNDEFSTCLHTIIAKNSRTSSSKSVIKLLLQKNADVEALNGKKETPLDVAFSSQNSDAFDLLLQYGADLNNMMYIAKINNLNICSFQQQYMICSLIAHVRKLDILEFYVDRFLKAHLENISKSEIIDQNDITLQCLKEIKRMKTIKISPSTTLFDVLHKDRNTMVRCVGNKNLETILISKSFEKKFPQLGFSLKLQFQRGLARKDLLKYSSDSLNALIGFHLPETIYDKISGYLLDAELGSLNRAGSEKCQKIEQKHDQEPLSKRQRL